MNFRFPFWLLLLSIYAATQCLAMDVSANINSGFVADNAENQRLEESLMIKASGKTTAFIANAFGFNHVTKDTVSGVLPWSMFGSSFDLGLQTLQGMWWFSVQAGFADKIAEDHWTASLVVARAIQKNNTKWTPILSLYRKACAAGALSRSLHVFYYSGSIELDALNKNWMSKTGLEVLQYPGVGDLQNRTLNSMLIEVPKNTGIRFWHYRLTTYESWNWGWSLKGEHFIHSQNTMTGEYSNPEYTWLPMVTPQELGELSVLLQKKWLVKKFSSAIQCDLPLFGTELRRWDGESKRYIGTAPIRLSTNISMQFTKVISTKIKIALENDPWEYWKFFDGNSLTTFNGNIDLNLAF